MKEKEMLKDETLEEVTGGVIPKEIEEGLLDFARNWAYLLYVGDGISRRSRDNINFHTRNCWGCGAAELDMFLYFEKMHAHDVTQEEFVDFVWEHRNEIPYIG